jgi:hypothetical protein
MQRANEQWKLDHRLGVAEKLDRIAEQNGNGRLYETAQRKREKAMQLFEKRMAKIDGEDPALAGPGIPEPALLREPAVDNPPWTPDTPGLFEQPMFSPPDPITSPPGPFDQPRAELADQRLLGRENAWMRQLTNEQRKLARQMEVADRLWQLYERTGNERLAETARSLEERALAGFERRIEAIADSQLRHGLSEDVGQDLISAVP